MPSRDAASTADRPADERRQHSRKTVRIRADVTLPGDLTIACHGSALNGVTIEAVVKHCELRGTCFHAGLQFPTLQPQVQAALEEMLRK